jgi:N6-adenosine-specific RNA methylase IME4
MAAAAEAGQIAVGRPEKNGVSETPFPRVTLAEAGVDKQLAKKARLAAGVGELAFEALIAQMRQRMASGRAILVDPVNAADKQARDDARRSDHAARTLDGGTVEDLATLAASGFKVGAILADPPWHFQTRSSAGEGRSANLHYKTDGLEAMMALPVKDLAADDCVLLMWMVDWCPQDALELIKAWGFEHKTTAFTWAKQNQSGDDWFMGQGYWTRANPEDCWLATRGHPKRLHADVRQLITAPIAEHSRKPDEIYDRIERLVTGPYLELYARRPRAGWLSWGNELSFQMPPHDPETGEVIEDEVEDLPNFLGSAASETV